MPRFDNPYVESPALSHFAELARGFCHLVETRGGMAPLDFVHHLHRQLPSLYAAGLRLPFTDVLYTDDGEDDAANDVDAAGTPGHPDRTDTEAWKALHRDLGALLAPYNLYREVFDPFKPIEDEPEVLGSLSDDVCDIYSDLSRGLREWERGETGAALWEWRFGLEHHWGEHATGALRALHVRAECWDTWFPPPDGPTR